MSLSALEQAIASLDSDSALESVTTEPAALEPAASTSSAIDDELAQLEALIGVDVSASTADSVELDLPTLEAVVSDIHSEETRAELYEKAAPSDDLAGLPDSPISEAEKVEEKVEEKAPRIKARAYGDAKPSAALVARLGSVEAVTAHLKISDDDQAKDSKALAELLKERLAGLDDLPKKVGEKAVNLIAHLGGGAQLSCYTEIAVRMLLDSGELTSKALFDRYLARPYSEGTSRSQSGQMMQLLPALGIADRTSRGTLTLRKDSSIAKLLGEAFKAAA